MFKGLCRAQTLADHKWITGYYFPNKVEGKHSGKTDWGYLHRYNEIGVPAVMEAVKIDRKTVGYYTGVFAFNLAPVIQGDIVEFTRNDRTIRGRIVFECGAYGIGVMPGPIDLDLLDSTHNDNFISLWELIYDQEEWDALFPAVEGLKVIGNIYDNPELLSGEERL